MPVLLDAMSLPIADREDAVRSFMEGVCGAMDVGYVYPAIEVRARFEYSAFGGLDLVRCEAPGLRLTRTERHVRAETVEVASFSYQVAGRMRLSVDDEARVLGRGDLSVTDLTRAYDATLDSAGANLYFNVGYDELGMSVDSIRLAAPQLATSPLYDLVRGHVSRLWRDAAALSAGGTPGLLGAATVELVRAALATTKNDDLSRNDAANEALRSRVIAYIQQHIGDIGLSGERIARAHQISVRRLYKLWSREPISLSEWIMAERLAGARYELARATGNPATVAAIARRWGFADATHFSRRFRDAYGMSPRDWRHQQTENYFG